MPAVPYGGSSCKIIYLREFSPGLLVFGALDVAWDLSDDMFLIQRKCGFMNIKAKIYGINPTNNNLFHQGETQ